MVYAIVENHALKMMLQQFATYCIAHGCDAHAGREQR